MRDAPDGVRRYVRAYVEGLHRFKTDKNFAMKVIGKYSRITDPDALEETYQHYAVKVMPKIPYPTVKGIQMVLDEIGSRMPKAKNLAPENFIDVSYLKELEQSGFFKKLYGE
jgi:NitT/TauT family transport system substrate-binding protein